MVSSAGGSSASSKLYEKSVSRKTQQLTASMRRKEEEEYSQACTFKPQLNKKSLEIMSSSAASSRTSESGIPHATVRRSASSFDPMAGCTFKPKTNAIKPSMEAAAVYLEQNAFERLSVPIREEAWKDRHSANTSVSSIKSGRFINSRAEPDASVVVSKEDGKNWDAFLSRQNEYEVDKRDRAAIRLGEASRVLKAPMSAHSAKLVVQAEFLERMAEREGTKQSAPVVLMDPACTFRPEISAYSKTLPKRSPEELCYGDYNKMQNVKQVKQLQARQEEARQMPFRPTLMQGTPMDDVQSSLRLGSDMDTYLARVQQLSAAKARKRESELSEKERQELAACTFAPSIHKSPAFVRNMVKDGRTYRKGTPTKDARGWNSSTSNTIYH
jgi:hypothetical protein